MDQDKQPPFRDLDPGKRSGLLREFWLLLRHTKKFWMLPLIVILLVLGLFILLGGSAAAPLIYRLF